MKSHAGTRVLVMDDEQNIRESILDYLEDCGFHAVAAASAEEALGMSDLDHVAVAIVDIRLGGMDGVNFIKRVHAQYPAISFLIHTGSTDFQLDTELRAIGLTDRDVFYKPLLDMSIFQRVLAEKIGGPIHE